jgi:hypothetical protein
VYQPARERNGIDYCPNFPGPVARNINPDGGALVQPAFERKGGVFKVGVAFYNMKPETSAPEFTASRPEKAGKDELLVLL